MHAQTPPVVTLDLLQRIAPSEKLLRAIKAGGWTNLAQLAEQADRPRGNLGRDLGRLEEAGLVDHAAGKDKPALTAEAVAGLAAADRATNPVRDGDAAEKVWTHADLVPNPDQPRKVFPPEAIAEIAASILSSGQLQNILARPNPYQPGPALQIVGGERRWRGMGLLIERGDWPADHPIVVKVRDLTDAQVDSLALVENMQRANLTLMEEARAFVRLSKVHGWTTAEIAKSIDKDQRVVQQRMNLLELNGGLTEEEQAQLDVGEITYTKALDLLRNRPKPLELRPLQALILAEVLDAAAGDAAPAYFRKAECAPNAATASHTADYLSTAGFLVFEGPDHFTGGFTARFADFQIFDRFVDQYPGLASTDRSSALLSIRATALDADEAERLDSEGGYDTPWLNGPFELTEEGKAIVEQRRQEQAENAVKVAESDAQRALRMRRLSEADARSTDMLAAMAKPRVGAAIDGFSDVLDAAEAPLPWSVGQVDGWTRIIDATGKPVEFPTYAGSPAVSIRLKLVMAAVNAAAGHAPVMVETTAEPEGDAEDDDEEAAEEGDDAPPP